MASWCGLPPPIQAARRSLHQLRTGREIPIGVAHAGVAEIGGKHWKPPLDIRPHAIPAEERPDREPVPEVMHARPGVIPRAAQASLTGQPPEDPVDVLVQQSTAALGDEEVRAAARAEMSIAPL